jgi:hypothetical protein
MLPGGTPKFGNFLIRDRSTADNIKFFKMTSHQKVLFLTFLLLIVTKVYTDKASRVLNHTELKTILLVGSKYK